MKTILQTTLTFIVLFSISLLLSSFTSESQEKSWETMYNEIKIEKEYFERTSEKLLKNWKECEQKKVELIK
jgi:hypothetical protein|tara:strand:- start:505 stop:717 length:213 start_codon:yes stop_codon:yes gene_type:complete